MDAHTKTHSAFYIHPIMYGHSLTNVLNATYPTIHIPITCIYMYMCINLMCIHTHTHW